MIKRIAHMVLNLVYPPNIYCICCERPIDGRFPYSMCPACAQIVQWANKETCQICGKPLTEPAGSNLTCADCTSAPREFDKGFACAGYGFTERKLIHDFKYRGKSYLAGNLGVLMFERIKAEGIKPDIVVPVPMYKNKERGRGYNQAGLLAGVVAGQLRIPFYSDLLVRTKDTSPMSLLNAKMRRENAKGVFKTAEWVQYKIKDKTILLVDDVFTTGSTAGSCSYVLKGAGALRVYVLTFASGADAGIVVRPVG